MKVKLSKILVLTGSLSVALVQNVSAHEAEAGDVSIISHTVNFDPIDEPAAEPLTPAEMQRLRDLTHLVDRNMSAQIIFNKIAHGEPVDAIENAGRNGEGVFTNEVLSPYESEAPLYPELDQNLGELSTLAIKLAATVKKQPTPAKDEIWEGGIDEKGNGITPHRIYPSTIDTALQTIKSLAASVKKRADGEPDKSNSDESAKLLDDSIAAINDIATNRPQTGHSSEELQERARQALAQIDAAQTPPPPQPLRHYKRELNSELLIGSFRNLKSESFQRRKFEKLITESKKNLIDANEVESIFKNIRMIDSIQSKFPIGNKKSMSLKERFIQEKGNSGSSSKAQWIREQENN